MLEQDTTPLTIHSIFQISVIQVDKAIKHEETAFLLLIKDEKYPKEILTDDEKLQNLLQDYQDIFSKDLPRLSLYQSVDYTIELVKDTKPLH